MAEWDELRPACRLVALLDHIEIPRGSSASPSSRCDQLVEQLEVVEAALQVEPELVQGEPARRHALIQLADQQPVVVQQLLLRCAGRAPAPPPGPAPQSWR
ncbi:MAG: hypothetical protein GY813_01845 [Halieaceae bacterium]|nr:hypothetical protein [Halieaceae bacterium]